MFDLMDLMDFIGIRGGGEGAGEREISILFVLL